MPVTGPTKKPNPHPFYGDNYERGKDPWHVAAFPPEFQDIGFINNGTRQEGWFLLDAWKNEIGFIPDGTPI